MNTIVGFPLFLENKTPPQLFQSECHVCSKSGGLNCRREASARHVYGILTPYQSYRDIKIDFQQAEALCLLILCPTNIH